MAGHGDEDVAERLIRHTHILACRMRHHLVVSQLLCFLVLAFEDELAYLGQIGFRRGVDNVVGLSGPERFLIQLDALYGWGAKHHATHDAIADG